METEVIENELKVAEEMKGHLNEYDRMVEKQVEVDGLSVTSQALTDKIELARNLPGEILKEANIPVKNLTVVNGVPLVNGLTISNLSEGEKLMLCVEVSTAPSRFESPITKLISLQDSMVLNQKKRRSNGINIG